MLRKICARCAAAVFAFSVGVVPVFAGDDSIVGPVLWLLGGSAVLILLVIIMSTMGKKKKK